MIKINFGRVDFAESAMALAFLTSQHTGVRVIFRPAETASTDGNKIILPPVKLKNEREWNMTEAFVLHEAAHIKFTDFDVYVSVAKQNPVLRTLLNIFEDCRIERELTKTLPGAAVKLEFLIQELLLSGELPQESMQGLAGAFNYALSVARQILYPASDVMPRIQSLRQALELQFSAQVLNETIAICQKSVTAKSTQDCVKFAQAVYDLFKDAYEEEKKKQEENQQQQQSGSSSLQQNSGGSSGQSTDSAQQDQPDNSSTDSDSSAEDGTGDASQGASGSGCGDSDNGEDGADGESSCASNQSGSVQEDDSQPGDSSGQGFGAPQDDSGQDANASSQNTSDSGSNQDAQAPGLGNGFSPNGSSEMASSWDELVSSIDEDAIQDYDKTLKGFVAGLEQETDASNYDMPTVDVLTTVPLPNEEIYPYTQAFSVLRQAVIEEAMKRRKSSATGVRLNKRRLATIAAGLEKKAFLSKTPQKALNTYICIMVDCSYSMVGQPIVTANYVLNGLRNALDTIQGIKLEVAGFSDSFSGGSAGVYPLPRSRRNVGFPAIGSTPISEALNWARFKCLAASESRKIIFLITDGTFDEETNREVQAKVKRYKKAGVETFGIFLGFSPCILPVGFSVNSAMELPAALKSIWKNLLYPDTYQE